MSRMSMPLPWDPGSMPWLLERLRIALSKYFVWIRALLALRRLDRSSMRSGLPDSRTDIYPRLPETQDLGARFSTLVQAHRGRQRRQTQPSSDTPRQAY